MQWAALLFLLPAGALPERAPIALDQALAGIEGTGALVAEVKTGAGVIRIRLFEERAPRTVAHFVGLARGLAPFKDVKTGEWVKRPFYEGLTFHRRVPKHVIQGGCPRGDGRGGLGYFIPDELHEELRHDKPGIVSLANDGPNRNGSQFFITEVPLPHLDGKNPVFGEVIAGLHVVYTIARSDEPVRIEKITILRR